MVDTLRRLVGSETCKILHEKLDDWYKDYHINSCDENLSKCCELIELNSKVQGQLFTILSMTARQGGHYGGIDTIKSRFLPWLGTCFSVSSANASPDTSFSLLQESLEKEKKLRELTSTQEQEMSMIESQLASTRLELDRVKQDLAETQMELEDTKTKSATTLLATEDEILQLRADLMSSKEIAAINERKLEILNDHERQIRQLKDEICLLSTEKSLLQSRNPRGKKMQNEVELNEDKEAAFSRNPWCKKMQNEVELNEEKEAAFSRNPWCKIMQNEVELNEEKEAAFSRNPWCKKMQNEVELNEEKEAAFSRLSRSRSPSPLPLSSRSPRASRSPSPLPSVRSESPTSTRYNLATRHAQLVSRFNDLYASDRLDAQNLLRRYIEDLELVQRILFIATMESFHAAKLAFRQFKLRVRKSLATCHIGPESLEDSITSYIVRNLDLYDVQSSVNEVICSMNVNPKIAFPPEVDFVLISGFIREVCRLSFAMQTLDPPLDLVFCSDGELFSESKYRRSFDSDFSAPLVLYHIWPALQENDCIIMKGEAVTRRGALWSPGGNKSRSSSPMRSRSASPSRNLSCRSRSPSPVRRSGTPRF
ncbi:mitochondria-eating protein isoform X2 [Rhinatrema bivittatum]|uniref:mitochondria-eating protein isoform X2 n=1 Tax=Rhinatrema bivittatum TaxID=194408 RepID=UPI00112DD318|nr:mitochondria-eating protein isoform X2 [Rhinatrema bivittatum]